MWRSATDKYVGVDGNVEVTRVVVSRKNKDEIRRERGDIILGEELVAYYCLSFLRCLDIGLI